MDDHMVNLSLTDFEFFSIILPGSPSTKLRLPDKFARELEGQDLRNAKLRVAGGGRRLWKVEVVEDEHDADIYLGRGWQRFSRAHDLRDGDLLVFRYDGDALFTVTVFDQTMCRRSYPPPGTSDGDAAAAAAAAASAAEAGVDAPAPAPQQFAVTLRKGNLGKKQNQYLNVPIEFQDAHGYPRKHRVVLQMGRGAWGVNLKHSRRRPSGSRTAFRYGWHQFCVDNGLAVGDTCFFRVLRDGDERRGEDHVLKVSVRKADGALVE